MKKIKVKTTSKKVEDEKGWFTLEEMFASLRKFAKTLETNQNSRDLVESSRKAWENWHGHAS